MHKMKTMLSGRLGPFLIIALSITLGASLAMNIVGHGAAQAVEQKSITPQQHAALSQLQDAFTALVADVQPSVVSIMSSKTVDVGGGMQFGPGMGPDDDFFKDFPFPFPAPRQQAPDPGSPENKRQVKGYGSGVIIRSDGTILTNAHVVDGADKVQVKLKDGRILDGKVTSDSKSDLAIIKINAKNLPAARLGDSGRLRVGSWAVAIGSPFELDQTVTIGVISGTGRQEVVQDDNGGAKFYSSLIQTDASINPGNSGGPLVNIDGEVIGINTLIRSGGMGGGSIGIGFAIPVNRVKSIVDKLLTSGKVNRGYLGIQPEDLTPATADRYGVKEGALVRTVTTDSPAEKGGLQLEDVIVEFNGRKIPDQNTLREAIEDTAPGTTVKVVVVRDKSQKTLDVKVGEPSGAEVAQSSKESATKLGFSVSDITSDITDKLKLPEGVRGVVVTRVSAGSGASEAGLQQGMVITRVNDTPVKSVAEFRDSTKSLKSGDTVVLRVRAKNMTTAMEFTID